MDGDQKGGDIQFKTFDIEKSKSQHDFTPTNVKQSSKFSQHSHQFSQWLCRHYRFLILIIIAIILIVVGVALVLSVATKYSNNEENNSETITIEHQFDSNADTEAIINDCDSYIAVSIDQGLVCWQDYIDANQSASNERKSALYTARANSFVTYYPEHTELADRIISDFKSADELNPTWQTAYNLYSFYYYIKDTTNAEQWKKTYEERMPQTQQDDGSGSGGIG